MASNPRAETVFKINGTEHKARPTFEKIAALEQRFGPIYPTVLKMQNGQFGVADVHDALVLILGNAKRGGPRPDALEEACMDNYSELLGNVAKFVTDAITDPDGPPPKGET